MKNLYNSDAYIREMITNVVNVKKIQWNDEDVYEFELEKTCFFPEQGGQTSDTGKLYDLDSNEVYEVFHCYIKDDTVYHLARMILNSGKSSQLNLKNTEKNTINLDFLNTEDTIFDHEKEVESIKNPTEQQKNFIGKTNYNVEEQYAYPTRVHGIINWDERFDKMQNHSGEHLVSGTVHRFFGFDNVGFSLSADNCTLDFNGTFKDEDIEFIENTVNRAVFENFETVITFPSPEELEKIEYRSKKELTGEVRIVEYPGYDICACCAPHVKRTGEIGLIKIVSAEHFKGGTRMTIRCGYRALKDFRTKLESCRSISQKLSVPIDEVSSGVEKLFTDLKTARFDLNAKMNAILSLKANEVKKDELPLIFIESADTNAVRATVNAMVKENKGICGIFTGNDEKGYSFIISSITIDCNMILNTLKTQLNAKGGGSRAMIQGSIPAVEKDIRAQLKLLSKLEGSVLI
ncbi:MAG: alanyl-tRNA editing protein [Lachnospiraceae bacterium]|nr:alanyl-tRNA editing protein [Lachnospiraceae bacterium]